MNPFGLLLGRELRIERRSLQMFSGALLLTVLVLLLSQLAWGPWLSAARLLPGAIWIALSLAGLLSLSRSLHREKDRGTWEALALLPVDAGLVFLAKTAANGLVLLVVAGTGVGLLAAVFDSSLWTHVPSLAVVLALGILGFAGAGTTIAAASLHARAREILLPILLLPFTVPLLMIEVQALHRVLEGEPLGHLAPEITLLAAMDVLFLAIGWLTFGRLLED